METHVKKGGNNYNFGFVIKSQVNWKSTNDSGCHSNKKLSKVSNTVIQFWSSEGGKQMYHVI